MSQSETLADTGCMQICNPLEIEDWDKLVAQFPGANFFHSRAWAQVIHETYGYQPMYLTCRDLSGLHSMLPLMEVRSWLTGRRGVSLPFTDSCGALCRDANSFQPLFKAALTLAEERAWKYLEYRGGRQWLKDAAASITFFDHTLELQIEDSVLFKHFDEGVRRAVKKAERSGLTIEFSQTQEAMQSFFTLHSKTRRRHGVPPQPFSFFANIQRHILAQKKGWVVLASLGQVPIAGAVFFHFGRSAIYKFGASDESYQNLRANNLVMWKAIQSYAIQGFTTLDFGRTSLSNEGLRRFKLSWGTRESHVEYVIFDRRKRAYTVSRDDSSGWHTRIFRMLPISVSKTIGKLLYRHLG